MVNYCVFLFVHALCCCCSSRHFLTKLFKYCISVLFFSNFFQHLFAYLLMLVMNSFLYKLVFYVGFVLI